MANPEKLALLRFMLQASLQHKCSKTGRSSAICFACEYFVQSSETQPATKTRIGFGMPKRGSPLPLRTSQPPFLKGALEGGQPFGVVGGQLHVHGMF